MSSLFCPMACFRSFMDLLPCAKSNQTHTEEHKKAEVVGLVVYALFILMFKNMNCL